MKQLLLDTSLPSEGSPIWVHTTVASASPQRSSQTVPHWLLKQISTRPSVEFRPPRSRISPSWQGTEMREEKLCDRNLVYEFRSYQERDCNIIDLAITLKKTPGILFFCLYTSLQKNIFFCQSVKQHLGYLNYIFRLSQFHQCDYYPRKATNRFLKFVAFYCNHGTKDLVHGHV